MEDFEGLYKYSIERYRDLQANTERLLIAFLLKYGNSGHFEVTPAEIEEAKKYSVEYTNTEDLLTFRLQD